MTTAASVTLPAQGSSSDPITKSDPGAALLRLLTDRSSDLPQVDPGHVAAAALRGRNAGSDFAELRGLAVEAAASMIAEDPQYSKLAARLLAQEIADEAIGQGALCFAASIAVGHAEGLIGASTAEFVAKHADALDALIDQQGDDRFEYFGLRTVQSRYLLRHPITRKVIETPQHFMLRVACGLAVGDDEQSVREIAELYALMSALSYLPSSPTLFNSGTKHPQMSSCYLLDSPLDNLDSIYSRYAQIARLSKHAGGIGLSYSRIRSRGSLIRGTNGQSNGIVPFLRTLDSSVAAVNQGGRRKGAACVYLETWHADIEEFLELRDNTGEEARRTHNLNLAHWIPDEFMRRVNAGTDWSLFSPADVPELVDLWGEEFDAAYLKAEAAGLAVRSIPRATLYAPDDAHPRADRQRLDDVQGRLQPRRQPDRAARPHGPLVQPLHGDPGGHGRLRDRRLQPRVGQPERARPPHRDRGQPGRRDGLGAAGRHRAHRGDLPGPRGGHQLLPDHRGRHLQLALAPGGPGRDGPAGRLLQAAAGLRLRRGQAALHADLRAIMLVAYERSSELAEQLGQHEAYGETRAARGQLHIDHFATAPHRAERWDALRAGSQRRACATRCCSPSRRPRPSPRSPASTSASSRRSPTCSSARPSPASSSRSTPTWSGS